MEERKGKTEILNGFDKCVYLGKKRVFPTRDGGEDVVLKKGMICHVKLDEAPGPNNTYLKIAVDLGKETVYLAYPTMVDVYIDWLQIK